MSAAVDVVIPAQARVGEGPHWDETEGRPASLLWVDILAGAVHRSDVDTAHTDTWQVPWLVGAAVPKRSGGLVAATEDGFAEIDPDGTARVRHDILAPGHRMNDAKCDPYGRFWAGSTDLAFAAGQGALHLLDADWQPRIVLGGFTLPNGMAWNPEGTLLYLVDTHERHLLAFDVDAETADVSPPRVISTFDGLAGLPDGMCIDDEGTLWIAMWGGSQVIRLDPRSGEVLTQVAVPVVQPSSCAFGGPGRATLFVTSATDGLTGRDDEPDGSVLRITGLDVTGPAAVAFAG